MNTKLAGVVAIILLAGTATAATLQHHPFSQLFPPDEDLDIGGKDILGSSVVETGTLRANGTGSDDLALATSGNTEVLRWDDANSVLEVPNSDLNMSGNRIQNLSDPVEEQDATTKSYVDTSDDTVSDDQTLSDVLSRGNGAGSNSIDMEGQSINNVNSLSTQSITGIVPFYIRGTGLNNDANRIVKIGGTQVVDNACRGLQLTVVRKSDYSITHNQCYDTFGSSSASDNLGAKLDDIGNTKMGILTSYDAWESQVTSGLDANFTRLGLYKAAQAPNTGSRRPYAAIFEGTGASEGAAKATEVLLSETGTQPHAEIRGFFIGGSYVAEGSKQSNLAGNQGRNPALLTDESQNVRIPNGNIDMNGNNLTSSGGEMCIGRYC